MKCVSCSKDLPGAFLVTITGLGDLESESMGICAPCAKAIAGFDWAQWWQNLLGQS